MSDRGAPHGVEGAHRLDYRERSHGKSCDPFS
jgi:hypothetical protein